ncbi:MAG: cation:proton antiporter [Candidatus Binatus sp.]
MVLLAIFVSLFFFFSLVSRRLERTILTAPVVFTVAGMLMSSALPSILKAGFNASVFLGLAEVGLVLLLFTDASQTKLAILRSVGNLPFRLLSIGMLLTIAFGTLAALLVFPKLSIWEAGILASVLAPTDAGLGQVIVNSPRVPVRIREALNVEAGLNDGLSVPFLLFFMAIAAAKIEGGPMALTQFIVEQLGVGALVGLVIGLGGGWLMSLARSKEWVAESFQQIGVVALPLLCLAVCEMLDASMFIASFVAGLAVQVGLKDVAPQSVEFGKQWGELVNLAVFFLFGLFVVRNSPQFDLTFWLYALLSLTVVRMLPVAIALFGTGLTPASVFFIGWFGPRGLASIVLGLVYLKQELSLPGEPTIRLALMVTVLLSIFAHGLSANVGIGRYARRLSSLADAAPERRGTSG